MNIFFLDVDPETCAKYHCDKHVVKMCVEYAQMLSTAHHVYDSGMKYSVYKSSYINHPMTKWVRESVENYKYTLFLLNHLNTEFFMRYGHQHKTNLLIPFLENIPDIPLQKWTNPPLCMPDECKVVSFPENLPYYVASYREYYKLHKASFATWKTEKPEWF